MLIFPAIDIHNGLCVRLTQGDFETVEQVASDALETAKGFRAAGAEWVHMVDLDGAARGERVHSDIFTQVARESGLKVQLGGGIRDMETVRHYLDAGVERVVIGSAALSDPEFTRRAAKAFGARVAVGIDAANGRVRIEGWRKDGGADYLDVAAAMEVMGIHTLIFTDISRDGTLSGPNIAELAALRDAVGCDLVASGGVADLNDVKTLSNMGLYAAICGKALYKGTLSLKEAVDLCRKG